LIHKASQLFVLIGAFACQAAIFFGFPALLLYRRLRLNKLFWFVIGGALIGVIVVLLLNIWLGWGSVKSPVVDVLAAALSATVFRLIAGRDPLSNAAAAPK
jgi:hypothetical protein